MDDRAEVVRNNNPVTFVVVLSVFKLQLNIDFTGLGPAALMLTYLIL